MQPNMSAIAEYKQKEEQYLQRAKELDDATNSRDSARKEFDDLRKQRLDCFMAGFSVITTKLKEMYQVCIVVSSPWLEVSTTLLIVHVNALIDNVREGVSPLGRVLWFSSIPV